MGALRRIRIFYSRVSFSPAFSSVFNPGHFFFFFFLYDFEKRGEVEGPGKKRGAGFSRGYSAKTGNASFRVTRTQVARLFRYFIIRIHFVVPVPNPLTSYFVPLICTPLTVPWNLFLHFPPATPPGVRIFRFELGRDVTLGIEIGWKQHFYSIGEKIIKKGRFHL